MNNSEQRDDTLNGAAKKVVHFSSVHPPYDIRIFHRECRTLVAAGYDVAYVVPHDKDEVVHGVRIRAVQKSKSRRYRLLSAHWRVFRRAQREKGRLYHFHDPELIPVALLMKLLGKRVIYDVHEDAPRSMFIKEYLPKPVRYVAAWLCELCERVGMWSFDQFIVVTPAIARRFPASKTVIVQNFPIMEEIMHEYSTPVSQRPPNVIYIGEISRERGIYEIIQALSLIADDLNVRLILAGKFASLELEREVRSMPGWHRVDFLGWRSRSEILEHLGRSRAGLVLFHSLPGLTDSQPAKLFEYMAAGIPLVASNFQHWRTIVEAENCGIHADPRDANSIAGAITRIMREPEVSQEMGRKGQQAVRERLNWAVEARGLLKVYERLTR